MNVFYFDEKKKLGNIETGEHREYAIAIAKHYIETLQLPWIGSRFSKDCLIALDTA